MTRRTVAFLTAVVLAVGITTTSAATPAQAAPVSETPTTSLSTPLARVPLVETMAGIGAVATEAGATVRIPGLAARQDAVLVRVSVFEVPETLDVLVAGAAALHVERGASGSATVLAPVRDGAIALSSTRSADIRVEVLAGFADSDAPGSTHAVEAPVRRADTATGLAGTALGADPLRVGVLGRGGIPAEAVRAVYLTATYTLAEPSTATVQDQQFPLPAGTTSVTTVVTPAADGTVPVSIAHGTGNVSVDVRGWVAEAAQGGAALNVTGSYVPASGGPARLAVSEGTAQRLTAPDEDEMVLALVWGTASAARAFVGGAVEGRARGVLSDAGRFEPQLLVTDGRVAARAADVDVTALILGGTLSATPAAGEPEIDTDLAEGATLDLTRTGWATLGGALRSSAALERVEVRSGGAVIGTAAVRYGSDGVRWSFETAAPEAGDRELTIRAITRRGAAAEVSRHVHFLLPGSDDAVASPDLVVLGSPASGGSFVASVTADEVILSEAPAFVPGAVIASAAIPTAPSGFLRRVVAIDRAVDGWRVQTVPATLTEAIVQARAEDTVDVLVDGADIDTDVVRRPDDSGVVIEDDGVRPVTLVQGDAVEVGPYPVETAADPASRRTPTASPTALRARGIDTTARASLSLRSAWAYDTSKVIDLTSGSDPRYVQTQGRIEASGGFTVSAEAQYAAQLHIVVDIDAHFDWGRPTVTVGEFSVLLETNARGRVALSAYLSAQTTKEFVAKLAKIALPTFTFYIPTPTAAVPVVVENSLELSLRSSIDAMFTARVEYAIQRSETYGFRYSDAGGLQDVHEGPTITQRTPLFGEHANGRAAGKIDAVALFEASLSMKIYGMLGPVFVGGIGPGLTAEFIANAGTRTLDAAVDLFLQMALSGRVEFTVPIIDRKLIDKPLFSLSTRIAAAHWQWSGDRIFDHGGAAGPRSDPGPLTADWAYAQKTPMSPGGGADGSTIVDRGRGRMIQFTTDASWGLPSDSPGDSRLLRVFDRDALRAVHRAPAPFSAAALDEKSGRIVLVEGGSGMTTEGIPLRLYDPADGRFGDPVASITGSLSECVQVDARSAVSVPGGGRFLVLGATERGTKRDDGTCEWEPRQRANAVWVIDAADLAATRQLGFADGFTRTARVQFSRDATTAYLFGVDQGLGQAQQVTLPLDDGLVQGPEPLEGMGWVDGAATDPRDGTIVVTATPRDPRQAGEPKLATNLWRVDPVWAEVVEKPQSAGSTVENSGYDYIVDDYRGLLFDAAGHLYGLARTPGPAWNTDPEAARLMASASGEITAFAALSTAGAYVVSPDGDRLMAGLDGAILFPEAAAAFHLGGMTGRGDVVLSLDEHPVGTAVSEGPLGAFEPWRVAADPRWYSTTRDGVAGIVILPDRRPALSVPGVTEAIPLVDSLPGEWGVVEVIPTGQARYAVLLRIDGTATLVDVDAAARSVLRTSLGVRTIRAGLDARPDGSLRFVSAADYVGQESIVTVSPDRSRITEVPITFADTGLSLIVREWSSSSRDYLAWAGADAVAFDDAHEVGYLVDHDSRVAAVDLGTGRVSWITQSTSEWTPVGSAGSAVSLAPGGGVWTTDGAHVARVDASGRVLGVSQFRGSASAPRTGGDPLASAQVMTDAAGRAVVLSAPTDRSVWGESTTALGYVWRFSGSGDLVDAGRLPLRYTRDDGAPVTGLAGFRMQRDGTVGWSFDGRAGLVRLE